MSSPKSLKQFIPMKEMKTDLPTQPCRMLDETGGCDDPNCPYSHFSCKYELRGGKCLNPFCGFHPKSAGKFKANYIKFHRIWTLTKTWNSATPEERVEKNLRPVNLHKFYLEIFSLQITLDEIRNAYENISDIQEFENYIAELREKIDLSFAYYETIEAVDCQIEYTCARTAVKYVSDNIIPLYDSYNEKPFNIAMYQYFAKFEKELEMARCYWGELAGIQYDEYTFVYVEPEEMQPEMVYDNEFPELGSC